MNYKEWYPQENRGYLQLQTEKGVQLLDLSEHRFVNELIDLTLKLGINYLDRNLEYLEYCARVEEIVRYPEYVAPWGYFVAGGLVVEMDLDDAGIKSKKVRNQENLRDTLFCLLPFHLGGVCTENSRNMNLMPSKY